MSDGFGTAFALRLDDGSGVALLKAYPRDRTREWAERQGRAVESDVAEMFGDGRRNHAPIELDYYVRDIPGRVNQARFRAELERQLAQCTALEFAPLSFEVQRARLLVISPTEDGQKLTLRFYGPNHDFTDMDGSAVPLI